MARMEFGVCVCFLLTFHCIDVFISMVPWPDWAKDVCTKSFVRIHHSVLFNYYSISGVANVVMSTYMVA